MQWDTYYQKPLTSSDLLSNLYGQRVFLQTIIDLKPRRILEIGSGSGAMAIYLSWMGFEVTSIDINPEVVKKAKSESVHLGGRARFEIADTFSLPYPDHSFDLVFHQGLLEHFTDNEIHKMLTEQLRVGKIAVVSMPNLHYPRRDFGNERLLSSKNWEAIFSPFQIVVSKYYGRKFFPKWYLPVALIQYLAVIKNINE